ncbi:hypothetical protein NPIL_96931 [Nephila pilipes]|uniref:Uncharacterized protein n=1 Tax=Nephila pilipes TaxID=299642 RepID=A0A8X6PZI7_NEPPI|nr:hypothetical protein NPIL_96931 [Nephila pilipes]
MKDEINEFLICSSDIVGDSTGTLNKSKILSLSLCEKVVKGVCGIIAGFPTKLLNVFNFVLGQEMPRYVCNGDKQLPVSKPLFIMDREFDYRISVNSGVVLSCFLQYLLSFVERTGTPFIVANNTIIETFGMKRFDIDIGL